MERTVSKLKDYIGRYINETTRVLDENQADGNLQFELELQY